MRSRNVDASDEVANIRFFTRSQQQPRYDKTFAFDSGAASFITGDEVQNERWIFL
ncbi:hypothetical protein K505DRAFT_329545 [Melanomma pulvis-pyrius CBS 109.77]|uniref:Uncharacterized protein n=1 Tax=Melanomma pulvis-pyrius CBS 109.77 TaxID=1314802 RepID=A0A6A6WV67_9PLEO|nr:hypothetical protein K505DRAFT_329545 [Melanomma pulvis-pyrius CBS 109.77]